ncbi:MAG: pilus assembly protein PilY [Gammaproteobacteria bacterium HGW-Gammaproteobacteria-11]|nr:MAG: pilus assembly protein PilY [Gammaproteobacteria bacterium HGW-Gammaproteobacteria-11]
MIMKTHKTFSKTVLSCLAFSLYLHAGVANANLDVSQQPLMLVDSVAPNLIFTIDDSGSMKRSHVPDTIADDNTMRTKRAKSAAFNPAYYDPNTTYIIPKGVNTDGSDIIYTTSFTTAYHMGFKTSFGSTNLSNNYRVTWYCTRDEVGNCSYNTNGFGAINELADNPTDDFFIQVNIRRDQTISGTTDGGLAYSITRTANDRCEFTGAGYVNNRFVCSQTSGSNARTATVDLRQRPVAAYYYVFDTERANCNGTNTDDDCYELKLVEAAEQQNFAIWYSFYRDRALATQSAAHLAFYELPSSVRFTWQSLNNCTNFNNGSGCNDNRFRIFGNRQKSNFLEWLTDVNFSGGTPLRESLGRAGEFLRTNVAWANEPNPFTASGGTSATVRNPEYSCRPSFHIMMTDGIWNGADGSPSQTLRPDHSSFNLPDNESFSGSRAPYSDATTNTLADLAMHYWATDLNPGLDNEIKPYTRFSNANADTQYWDPRNNPSDWQNMTNYMVGLGLSSALNDPDIPWADDTFKGGFAALSAGTENWPAAGSGSANNVYDLWHAAINSRGEFFSADSPGELVTAFNDIINRIAERTSTAGKPGVSSSVSLDGGDITNVSIINRIFETRYDSEDGWAGDLVRKDVVRLSNGGQQVEEVWAASSKIDAQSTNRNIFMAGGGTNGLKDFTWTNIGAANQTLFNLNPDALTNTADGRGAARLNYLRGARTAEGNGPTDFRARKTVLGDIINSSPEVVGMASNVPYLMDRIDGDRGDYLEYLIQTQSRPELVYVGANDGMLHAIFTGTDTAASPAFTGGSEAFAFIPSAVIPNLPKLAGQSFKGGGHRYYVDGSPIVRDVFIGGEWRTVLVGTLRAGGKSVFALDITDPGIDGSGVKLLWEISNQDSDYEDLGFTFARPEIARLHSGQWGVLLGNGYDSNNGAAAMYVIDIADGSLLRKLEVDDGTEGSNGLSSVRGADNNSDGVVDYAYAGDLKGNVWRFDLVPTGSSSAPDPFARSAVGTVDPSVFKVAYGGQPMFTADYNGLPQAITAIPSLVRHPTRRGYLVIVGTGKYFETADSAPDTSKANSLYAIWDRYSRGENTTAALASASRSNMEERNITTESVQTFNRETGGSVTSTIRIISEGAINWYTAGTTRAEEVNESAVARRGWYLDLAVGNSLEGEMLVNEMLARGNTLLFSTIIPDDDPCADGLNSFLYGINAQTGARLALPPFDFNRDGRITSGDLTSAGLPPSGIQLPIPGGIPLTRDGLICGNDGVCIELILDATQQGRTTWQNVPPPEEEN